MENNEKAFIHLPGLIESNSISEIYNGQLTVSADKNLAIICVFVNIVSGFIV